MKNKYTGTETDLIINKINSLYPDFTIAGITKSGNDYIVDIKYDPNIIGSAVSQKWTIENRKAVFKETIPKN